MWGREGGDGRTSGMAAAADAAAVVDLGPYCRRPIRVCRRRALPRCRLKGDQDASTASVPTFSAGSRNILDLCRLIKARQPVVIVCACHLTCVGSGGGIAATTCQCYDDGWLRIDATREN